MAKQSPHDNFLGGGARFNSVGGAVPDADPSAGDTGPIPAPPRRSPGHVRTLIIVVVIALLAAVLYVVSDFGLGGVETHTHGAGVSPAEKPDSPPKNF